MSVSDYIIPAIICAVIAFSLCKKTDAFGALVDGAKDGIAIAVSVLPNLIGLIVAVRVFEASGAMDILEQIISPLARFFHFPKELVSFALFRPVSGSGSLAVATELFQTHGPDSFIGRAVSVMMGSTETTFYTVAVYFGAVGLTDTRHTLKCALFADFVCAIMSVIICRIFF